MATLEELKAVEAKIEELRKRHPEALKAVAELLKRNRGVGYKNICKMVTGEATPEKLKRSERQEKEATTPVIRVDA